MHKNNVIQITYLSSKNKNYWVKCYNNEKMNEILAIKTKQPDNDVNDVTVCCVLTTG